MIVLKENVIGHIFFIIWWSIRRGIKFKTRIYLSLLVCINYQTNIGLLIIWTTTFLTVWVILGDHHTFLFLVPKISFFLKLGILSLHVSRIFAFKAGDFIAPLFVVLLEPCVLSFRGVMKLLILIHDLFELFGHEGHLIIYESFKVIWSIKFNIFTLRASDKFLSSLPKLVSLNLRAAKSFFCKWSLI